MIKVYLNYKEACHKLRQNYTGYDELFKHNRYSAWIKPHTDNGYKQELLCELIGNNTYIFFCGGEFVEVTNGNCIQFDCNELHALFPKYTEEEYQAKIYKLKERNPK